MEILAEVVKKFGIGPIEDSRRIVKGKINETYLVSAAGLKSIIQKTKVRPHEASDHDRNVLVANERTKNFEIVFEALGERHITCPRPIPLLLGSGYVAQSADGCLWRAFGHIEHNESVAMDGDVALDAGKALGIFHQALRESAFQPKFPIPDFHDSGKVLEALHRSAREKGDPKFRPVRMEFMFLSNEVPKLILPPELPKTLIHGDPKLDNFLFGDKAVKAIIDLDSLMLGSVYLDIGDALRSWCRIGNRFSEEICNRALEAYGHSSGNEPDRSLAIQAVKLITLELAARYLTDYFQENYFAWDSSLYESAAEHNLERARSMISYFNSIP